MREYELYLVIDADAEDVAVEALVERVSQLVATGGGEVIKVEPRGKRRLTYAIKRKQESQDIIVTFQGPPQALVEIERFLKLDEQVLRYLLVRTDDN